MITYHHNIMKLMNGGPNWRTYDFQFRAVREYQQCPWDTVRVDLKRDAYLGLGMASRKNHIVNTVQDVQEKIFQFTIFLTHLRDVETLDTMYIGVSGWIQLMCGLGMAFIRTHQWVEKKYKASLRLAIFKSVEHIHDYN